MDLTKPNIRSNWPSMNAWWIYLPGCTNWAYTRTWPEALAVVQRWYLYEQIRGAS